MSTKKISLFFRTEFLTTDSYSCTKLKLVGLHKLLRQSSDQDVVNGIFNKLLDIFISKNKYIKNICIEIFKDIHNKINVLDNIKIIRMFYQNDPDITKLTLKFVKIFYRFFVNDDILIYYVIKSKSKYKYKVLDRLLQPKIDTLNYNKFSFDLNDTQMKILTNCVNLSGKSEILIKKIINKESNYEYKNLIKFFHESCFEKSKPDYIFEIYDCQIGADLICKINGYRNTRLYKKIKKCIDNNIKL